MDTIGWLIHALESAQPVDDTDGEPRPPGRVRPLPFAEPLPLLLLDRFWAAVRGTTRDAR